MGKTEVHLTSHDPIEKIAGTGLGRIVIQDYLAGMTRFAIPLIALGLAVMAAVVMASVAHYGLGIPRATIRTDAIAGIALIGSALMITRAFQGRSK